MAETASLAVAAVPALAVAPTWADALDSFLNLQNSPRTRTAYARAIGEAMAAMGATYPADLTPPMLAEYRGGLVARLDAKGARRLSPASVALNVEANLPQRSKRLSPASVALKLAALRGFLKFCRLTGLTVISAEIIAYTLESPSAKVVKPYDVLTPSEAARVLAALADSPRDRALVALALGAGLRAAELTGVRLSDVIADDDGGEWVRVVMGKGRKDRLVPLAPDVAAVIRAYAGSAKLRKGDYLFQSRQGESSRMTTARVWQVVKDAVKAAGIHKRLSTHSLRHTFALGRLKAGASPVIVQKLMGHASIQTTQKYLDHLDLADLRAWAAPLPSSR